MSVSVVVELTIRPEHADAYSARLQQAFIETRSYPGCEQIAAYRDQAKPGRFVVVEQWLSQEHYQNYFEWRRAQGVFDRLAGISEVPMAVSFLSRVA